MDWKIEYFSDAIPREILELPSGLLARYIHLTDRMIAFGPNLGVPHTLSMDKGLFELRLKAAEGIARAFYFVRTGQRIVMLHQFVKKTQKTPPKELKIARRRMKELQNA
ncbi:MAG: type II toxin-antitoxin system RelE/ParE family toxin [Betaproteobacteria bacterium]|nr:type II toxin-antitoxin system RelE/ParE family toxin [Betaproteobacteria bacterium]